MADLESFFAKKDKKKKTKKTGETPEDLLKKIEQDPQGAADAGYDSSNGEQQPAKATSQPTGGNKQQDDEEWNEFETDKEIDLSSLKIQNLGEKEKERLEEEEQEDFQKAVEESKTTMKWNIAKKEDSSDDEEEEEEQATQEKKEGTDATDGANKMDNPVDKVLGKAASTGRYIPPGEKAAMNSPASGGPTLAPMSIKRLPGQKNRKIDVNSVEDFPSLGVSVKAPSGAWGGGGGQDGSFTSVKKGAARTTTDTSADALSTSNKFSMLKSGQR